MDERELAQLQLENRKLALEERKATLDFWKFFWGSCFAAIAIAAIPPLFQFATAYLENARSTAQLQLEQQNKEAERLSKQQEFRNSYIKEFLNTALTQDVELRVRFAEYFANVSPEEYRSGWIKYLDSVRGNRNDLRDQIDAMETGLLKLQDQSDGADARRLQRRLQWAYGELGYVAPNRSVAVNPRASATVPSRNEMIVQNERLFQSMVLDPEKKALLAGYVRRIVQNKPRYEPVEAASGVRWYVVAMLHALESSSRFDVHLHNGDSLASRTVRVPAGRPTTGDPPFTWEQSALDALSLYIPANEKPALSSIGGILYVLERANGFGYRSRNVASPYIWGCTSNYTKGKFVRDGIFDPEAVSQGCGAAALLKALIDENHVDLKPDEFGAVSFAPAKN